MKIWQNCVERAIAYLEKNHWDKINDSTKYDLVFKNKKYPTKLILGQVYEYIQQENPEIHLPTLGGGKPIKLFLEKLGFEIKQKETMEHNNDFFNKLEFEALNKSNGLLHDKSKPELSKFYSVLKTAYEKLHYLTEIVQKETFTNGSFNLIKKPINQGNHFQGYLWSKIYPTKEDKDKKWLAFTLGLDSDFHYNFKIDTVGINDDNDSNRKKYLNYRGDFYNSQIVFRPKFDAFNNWDELIDYCVEKLELLEPHYQKIKNISKSNVMNQNSSKANPLNKILYGPPGTGKTYTTINKAISIANPNFDLNQDRGALKIEYDRLVNSNQIMFTTFHQSMSYEDFIEGIKPETKNENVTYDVQDGLFLKICKIAEDNIEDARLANNKMLSFEDAFSILQEEWFENEDLKFPLKREGNDFTIIGFTNKSIQFKKASGGVGHTLSIATLRNYFYNKIEINLTGVGIYFPSILDKLKTYQPKVIEDKTLKNYVLIIDEINRGNVSAIFGELITLIEEDKRIGKPEALMVTLPYSKKPFGVPANLYIIGTMNTADRSVEALDTALRRRFSFEEMPPNYELPELSNELFGYPASKILKTINHRIEKLLDKDHAIGHSYFINKDDVSIVESFYKCIIPLLQEYFFGDFGKIGLVLGNGFVKLKEWDKKADTFAVFDEYQNSSDFEERNVFEIIDYRNLKQTYKIKETEMTFGLAIKLLMNDKIE